MSDQTKRVVESIITMLEEEGLLDDHDDAQCDDCDKRLTDEHGYCPDCDRGYCSDCDRGDCSACRYVDPDDLERHEYPMCNGCPGDSEALVKLMREHIPEAFLQKFLDALEDDE